jgi:hypothetical protein
LEDEMSRTSKNTEREEPRWDDATDPKHVRGLARSYARVRREVGAPPLAVVGALPEWDDEDPDADLSAELADLEVGVALASEPGGKLPKPVPGYLDRLDEGTAASTGCQLHDAGVRRCIAAEWSFRAVVAGPEVLPGRVAVISDTERARTPTPAMWRLSVSLPWFLLAKPEERSRGIAHLLAQCGWDATKGAYVRRPDFAGFSHVIQRHGLAETKANAAALAKVASSRVLVEMLQRHYPAGAQGLLFGDSKVIEGES